MRIIVWRSRDNIKHWSYQRKGGYKAGDLVEWICQEYVCVNTHKYALYPPNTSSLWAKVLR